MLVVMVYDAPDGCFLYEVAEATDEEIEGIATRAQEARVALRDLPSGELARTIAAFADHIEQASRSFAEQIVLETGRPLLQAKREVDGSVRVLNNYARLSAAPDVQYSATSASARVRGHELYEPLGVALAVTPWNFPLQVAAHKLGAALVARCPVIWKPSPLAAGTAALAARAISMDAMLARFVHVLNGHASTVHRLVASGGVDVVSFTGGLEAGRAVMQSASRRVVPTIMELGGKNANIVFADADIDSAAASSLSGLARNQGASCTACTRILVHESVISEFAAKLVKQADALCVGDPYIDASEAGAVRTSALAQRTLDYSDQAQRSGASALRSPHRVEVRGRSGWYLSPGLIWASSATRAIDDTEVFGPLATIDSFSDDDEAIAKANDASHGLVAGVWTSHLDRAAVMARRLEVGTVFLNHYNRIDNIPLATTGRKISGYGSEGGTSGVRAFQTVKSIHHLVP